MKKQRTFTAGFKAKVALEAVRGVKTLEKISSEYEVHQTQINKWKNQGLKNFGLIFEKNDIDNIERIKNECESEVRKLYEEIGRLKVENDFLKKTQD